MIIEAVHDKPCSLCGHKETKRLFQSRDYISGEWFWVARCDHCGLVRTSAQPNGEERMGYYGSSYFGTEGRRFSSAIELLIRISRNRRAKEVICYVPGPGNVLDIGCGRGLMLAELKRRGWQCVGTEYNPELAAAIQRKYAIEVKAEYDLTDCHFASQSFDVVTLWHTLEHMDQPRVILKEIYRILKQGGVVIIEVPNFESFQERAGQGSWFHLDAPRHLYHFSLLNLQTLLEDEGFTVIRRQTFSLEYGLYGMVQTLLNRLTIKPNVLFGFIKRRKIESKRADTHCYLAVPWDYFCTVFFLLQAVFIGTFIEVAGCVFERGGIAKIVARKDGFSQKKLVGRCDTGNN